VFAFCYYVITKEQKEQEKAEFIMKETSLDNLAKQERREYQRRWRAANKEKVQKHNANYWKNRATKKLAEAGGDVS
jgi:hypothetical protein